MADAAPGKAARPQTTVAPPTAGPPRFDVFHPHRWSVDEVCSWLVWLDLAHCVAPFQANAVDGETLLELTRTDLVDDLEMRDEANIELVMKEINTLAQRQLSRSKIVNVNQFYSTKKPKQQRSPASSSSTSKSGGVGATDGRGDVDHGGRVGDDGRSGGVAPHGSVAGTYTNNEAIGSSMDSRGGDALCAGTHDTEGGGVGGGGGGGGGGRESSTTSAPPAFAGHANVAASAACAAPMASSSSQAHHVGAAKMRTSSISSTGSSVSVSSSLSHASSSLSHASVSSLGMPSMSSLYASLPSSSATTTFSFNNSASSMFAPPTWQKRWIGTIESYIVEHDVGRLSRSSPSHLQANTHFKFLCSLARFCSIITRLRICKQALTFYFFILYESYIVEHELHSRLHFSSLNSFILYRTRCTVALTSPARSKQTTAPSRASAATI
jgi:hypothetical protein